MIFSWLRRRRRARVLAAPFPDAWLEILKRRIAHYPLLTDRQQSKLRDDLRVFITEKHWEGCGGLVLKEEMKVVIAAQACLITLELDGEPLAGVPSILVYPAAFRTPKVRRMGEYTLVGEQALAGEAHYRGAVVLNWTDVNEQADQLGGGDNLVWHEFAHQLDMLDGAVDGAPPMADDDQRQRWHDVMTAEFRQHQAHVRHREPTLIHPGAVQDPGEFFAYTTECFFDCPVELRDEHPQLYAVLSEFYRQDPAARISL